MSLLQDITRRIVNVHWGGGEGFLYSGADGMFASKDGATETWKAAPASVPAASLAFIDGVWVACRSGVGCWRSTDGATSWEPVGFDFKSVAACKLIGATDEGGEAIHGIFAGHRQEEASDEVYVSLDLGKTWSLALSIPTEFSADGTESLQALSGCGNCLFVTTVRNDTALHRGDGLVYAAMNSGNFGGGQRVWVGTVDPPFGGFTTYAVGYSAASVGFDETTQRYTLTGVKRESTPVGEGGALGAQITQSIIYATSPSGDGFSGEGIITSTVVPPLADNFDQVSGGFGTAGGDGKFATGIQLAHHTSNFSILAADLQAVFFNGGSGSTTLLSPSNLFDGDAQIGPICWHVIGEAETGTWACAAVDSGGASGVWIAAGGGSFSKTHSGEGFSTNEPRAAIGFGKISFFDSDSAK